METTPGADFDLVSAVTDAVRDRHATWRFLREYAQAWHRPLGPADGLDASELKAIQRRLVDASPGIHTLPNALLESYALLGKARDLISNQDTLLSHRQVHLDRSGQTVVVRIEAQGCARWGIRVSDLESDDPPTVMQVGSDTEGWTPYAARWSLAFLEWVLVESLVRDPDDDTTRPAGDLLWDTDADDSTVATIRQHYQRLPVPELPHWCLPSVHWYAGPDLLIRDEAQTWVWARGRTAEALKPLHRLLRPQPR